MTQNKISKKVKWCVEIDSDLDDRFRKAIAKRFGLHRGVIDKARNEAIEDWIKKHNSGNEK